MTKVKLYSHLGNNGSTDLNANPTNQICTGLRYCMLLLSGICLPQFSIFGDNPGFCDWLDLPELQQQFQKSPEQLVLRSWPRWNNPPFPTISLNKAAAIFMPALALATMSSAISKIRTSAHLQLRNGLGRKWEQIAYAVLFMFAN